VDIDGVDGMLLTGLIALHELVSLGGVLGSVFCFRAFSFFDVG